MKLVVGYLATPGGADAVALGVRLARTIGAELEICVVMRAPSPLNQEYQEELVEQGEQWLADAVAAVPEGIAARTHVSFHESFADGICREAERLGAAGIVVGGAGGGLVGSFTLGSVVNELLHSAPVPVAVAPRGTRHSDVDRIRSITCAVGRRTGAGHLIDTAMRFSAAAHTPLRLVSLVTLDEYGPRGATSADALRRRAVEHASETLDETARASLPQGFPVTAVVAPGATVEAAAEQLEWHDGDLIMVGSSRLAAPRRLFLGSTAAKMLRVLQVPLVVVPSADTPA
ncbi:nucleotide-binding universal stress UspA family protein [Mycobacterium frederiksbergense]|uniref:Nucleotide-binding universal stress UspA family protein n=1 Tax=Mycolicibacterium frederiksbergense TaxID=117567 RepID=A0ABT6KTM3_9MYCO|nr:universal stress protein [Mycolicibacterium frederiksbergense]MDH6194078.1 nucleotide-binding universal stress UspA family protein [Mycolicibacterium frederiksbergense]